MQKEHLLRLFQAVGTNTTLEELKLPAVWYQQCSNEFKLQFEQLLEQNYSLLSIKFAGGKWQKTGSNLIAIANRNKFFKNRSRFAKTKAIQD